MASPFTPEFKARVVLMVRHHRGALREVAERFGIAPAALWRWLREADREVDMFKFPVVRVPGTPPLYVLWSLSLAGPLTPLLSREEMALYLRLEHRCDDVTAAAELGRADQLVGAHLVEVVAWLDGAHSSALGPLAVLIDDFTARFVAGDVGEAFVLRLIVRPVGPAGAATS